jgi:hypothetical protein
METDVTSPTSTCTSEVSFSVGSSDESSEEESSKSLESCIICFCSDEETESHDCTVCTEGAWKICKKCKEKMNRIDKCPVCMTENLNYEEPSPPLPPRRQNVVVRQRNFYIVDLIIQGLWKDVLLECLVYIFKLFVCILYSSLGVCTVYIVAYITESSHCFLQLFLSAIMCIIFLLIPFTLLYDPRDESGKIYRLCIAPILSIIILTFSGLLNRYCAVVFVGKLEVLIIGGVSLFCYSCYVGKILIDEET